MSTQLKRLFPLALALLIGCCFLILDVSGIAGAWTASIKTQNNIALDTVSIKISDIERAGSGVIYDDEKHLCTTAITNTGATCWLRLQASSVWESGNKILTDDSQTVGTAWIIADDGWFYLTEPLDPGALYSFCIPVGNPLIDTWDKEGFDFTLVIEAQAVQMRNVTPDFSDASPWGDISPEQAIYTDSSQSADTGTLA